MGAFQPPINVTTKLGHRADPEGRVSIKWIRFFALYDMPAKRRSLGPKSGSTFGSEALAGRCRGLNQVPDPLNVEVIVIVEIESASQFPTAEYRLERLRPFATSICVKHGIVSLYQLRKVGSSSQFGSSQDSEDPLRHPFSPHLHMVDF